MDYQWSVRQKIMDNNWCETKLIDNRWWDTNLMDLELCEIVNRLSPLFNKENG